MAPVERITKISCGQFNRFREAKICVGPNKRRQTVCVGECGFETNGHNRNSQESSGERGAKEGAVEAVGMALGQHQQM